MIKTAVIDNDSLVNLSYLHKSKPFFHCLRNLFGTVYFPSEVVKEYSCLSSQEPHRDWIISRLKPEDGFYRYCASYDSIVLATVETASGINKGEAETYAQFMKVSANLIISDDKPFIEALKKINPGARVYSTLHIICWLEHAKLIVDWSETLKDLYKVRPFKSKELREAYLHVAEHLSINVPKKIVSSKCSLSKIL